MFVHRVSFSGAVGFRWFSYTTWQMRKGDMLYCHQPLVQIDETKFGTDAREFNPKRFVGNPDLKKDVSVERVW